MVNEKRIVPDPRLEQLLRMVGKCTICADVGSDHGRLGACLLQSDQCDRVVMTDISEPSLMKARRLIRLLELETRVHFGVGDGLSAIGEPADVVVIAGMGGDTIAHIMQQAQSYCPNARFLLQPNVAIPELRTALCDLGFMITDEALVRDGRRIYTIIEAVAGNAQLDEAETEIGPVLMKVRPSLLKEFAQFRYRVLKKAMEGAKNGSDISAVEELTRRLRIWEEYC